MMKKFVLSLLVVMTGLIIISCNGLVTPSKVQVKGSPSVYAPLGSKTVTLSEYLNTDDIIKMMGADKPDSTMTVYEYPFTAGTTTPTFAPGVADDNMRFLVHYPLTSVDLDFTEYLDKLNFAQDFSNNLPEQVFTVPSIDSPPSQTIDFNGVLLTTLNVIPALTVPVVTLEAAQVTTLPIDLPLTGFSSATFSVGTMTLEIDAGGTTGLQITGVRILDNAGTTTLASATEMPVDLLGTKTVSIPLVGVTLTNNVKIAFDITATNLTNGNLSVTPRFTTDTRLSEAAGVTLSSQSLAIPSATIPAINDPLFVEATIGTGNITLAIALTAPTGVITGFNRALTLSLTGGLNAGVTNNTGNPHVISLNDKTFDGTTIEMSGNVTLSAPGAGATFSNLGTTGLVFSVEPTINISNFSSVTVKPGTGFEFEQTVTQELSQDLKDWVTSIDFNEVGLKLTFTNGLPVGNDIPIQVISPTFGINEPDFLIAQTSPASASYSFTNGTVAIPYHFLPANYTDIEFTFNLTPPGYNSVDGTMTLEDLEPGETFGFSLDSVEMVTDWKEMVVEPVGAAYTGTFPEAGGDPLDFSTLTDYLGNGLGFAEIPMYLYLSGPEFTATATVTASYKDGSNATKTPDLFTHDIIAVVAPLTIVQTDGIVTGALTAHSASLTGFADILNDNPHDLEINYSIEIGTMTIVKADDGIPPPLKADLVIVLPLAFVANGPESKAIIDFNSLMGENPTDLLGRKEGEEDKSLDDVFENLKSMAMKLDINNNLGLEGTLIVSAGTGADPFRKELIIGSPGLKKTTLDLTKDDIEFIKRNNPFTPSFSLEIPNGTYHLKKNAGMDVKITLSIETDIDYSIDLQGGK